MATGMAGPTDSEVYKTAGAAEQTQTDPDARSGRDPRAPIYARIRLQEDAPGMMALMGRRAARLADAGWRLRTGGADGADSAFSGGTPTGRQTICLP